MSAILQRLQSSGFNFPEACDELNAWTFSEQLREKDIDFFRNLVRHHTLLRFEYGVLCTQLAHDFIRTEDHAQLTQSIKTALILAEALEVIYRDYLYVPREVERLRREQAIYKHFLMVQGYQFIKSQADKEKHINELGISKTVHETSATLNWFRLYSIRTRRLLVSISALTHEFSSYRQWIDRMDQWARPALAYFGWIFFIPRLLVNLVMMAKHTIPGWWMSKNEYDLGLKTRFMLQWQRRWFFLGNDSAWLTVGLLNCFVLTGVLSPFGLYLSLALQVFDIAMAVAQAHIEISRMRQLQKQYAEMLNQKSMSAEEQNDIRQYQYHLEKRIAHERKRLGLIVINTVVLLLALSLAIPALAFNPLIPVLGAALAVLTTIVVHSAIRQLQKQKPTDDVSCLKVEPQKESNLARHGLFKPSPSPLILQQELQISRNTGDFISHQEGTIRALNLQ
ncbi:hypothetical protein [Legionella nagasakiensis]|uniref:hypothetical protein n=1 Tax=Legionella nagasakiensis TaxID=535290 RepID=UPI001055545B|nr:hypothetical protein [Legionella nagasakiensis]